MSRQQPYSMKVSQHDKYDHYDCCVVAVLLLTSPCCLMTSSSRSTNSLCSSARVILLIVSETSQTKHKTQHKKHTKIHRQKKTQAGKKAENTHTKHKISKKTFFKFRFSIFLSALIKVLVVNQRSSEYIGVTGYVPHACANSRE